MSRRNRPPVYLPIAGPFLFQVEVCDSSELENPTFRTARTGSRRLWLAVRRGANAPAPRVFPPPHFSVIPRVGNNDRRAQSYGHGYIYLRRSSRKHFNPVNSTQINSQSS